jgi:hypothetical protein
MADELSPRWCPFVALASSRRAGGAFNRVVENEMEDAPKIPLATCCVEDKCQMWTGSDCGLKHG